MRCSRWVGSIGGACSARAAAPETALSTVVDKAGALYILRPPRVLLATATADKMSGAVPHEVIEDREGWTFYRLREEGFSELGIDALPRVAKLADNEDCGLSIDRAMSNPLAGSSSWQTCATLQSATNRQPNTRQTDLRARSISQPSSGGAERTCRLLIILRDMQ
jgi:hypothetical protein